jgi:hypothetical protein
MVKELAAPARNWAFLQNVRNLDFAVAMSLPSAALALPNIVESRYVLSTCQKNVWCQALVRA